MLVVYKKTEEEIQKEQTESRVYARMVKGTPELVCPYYVVTKDGERLDVSKMTEEQILSFLNQAILSVNKQNTTRMANGRIAEVDEAFKLTEVLRGPFASYKPSWEGLKSILKLYENDNVKVSGLARDLFTPFAGEKLSTINTIASYIKESKQDITPPTYDEMCRVIDQMAKNERYKNLSMQFK